MKIGIYGGTFNPPHLGHMAAAKTAAQVLGLDRLILIPTATPPHKQLPEATPEAHHRLAMTELMADGVEFKDYNQKNIGFSLLVNENSLDEDGVPTGRTGWIEYMSGIGVRKDPTKYGDLILVELPEK